MKPKAGIYRFRQACRERLYQLSSGTSHWSEKLRPQADKEPSEFKATEWYLPAAIEDGILFFEVIA